MAARPRAWASAPMGVRAPVEVGGQNLVQILIRCFDRGVCIAWDGSSDPEAQI